jgi:hypothetical protein
LRKPIVLLELKGAGQEFSFEDAFGLLSDLKTNLRTLNPSALVELNAHSQMPLSELQEAVKQAVEVSLWSRVRPFNING